MQQGDVDNDNISDDMATLDEDSLSDASLIEDDDDEGGKMDTDDDVGGNEVLFINFDQFVTWKYDDNNSVTWPIKIIIASFSLIILK